MNVTFASQTLQIEEKRYAHRRGSDATRPVSILGSPMISKVDTFPDGGSHVGSFKLSAIPEPLLLPESALETTFDKPEDHGIVNGVEASQGKSWILLRLFIKCDCGRNFLVPVVKIPSEHAPIMESFRKCLELRDKYMHISGQQLGFNPKDYDGSFQGLDDSITDVSGVKPNADYSSTESEESQFSPWRIYPKPPPPHWHLREEGAEPSQLSTPGDEEFEFEQCEIPGAHEWDFAIDEKGVYQVYNNAEGGVLCCVHPQCQSCNETDCLQRARNDPLFSIFLTSVNTSWTWSTSLESSRMVQPRVTPSGG